MENNDAFYGFLVLCVIGFLIYLWFYFEDEKSKGNRKYIVGYNKKLHHKHFDSRGKPDGFHILKDSSGNTIYRDKLGNDVSDKLEWVNEPIYEDKKNPITPILIGIFFIFAYGYARGVQHKEEMAEKERFKNRYK
jgi:hypothetical protein